jgi:hypothetical protein
VCIFVLSLFYRKIIIIEQYGALGIFLKRVIDLDYLVNEVPFRTLEARKD